MIFNTKKITILLLAIATNLTTTFAEPIIITHGNENTTTRILCGSQWLPRIIYPTLSKNKDNTVTQENREIFLPHNAAAGIPDTTPYFYVELPTRIIINERQEVVIYQPEYFYFNRSLFTNEQNYILNFNSMLLPMAQIYCRLVAADNSHTVFSFGNQPKDCNINSLPEDVKQLLQKLFPKSH
jgi:hypothetical protein